MNAINGVYDFLLHKQYDRGGGEALEIDRNREGLLSAVQGQGTLNAP